jgi:NADPH:quinone reductase-like Zn-dependent oxidoreductase
MSFRDLIFEPEVLSSLFLLVNLIGIVFILFFVQSWLFLISFLCVYIVSIFLINRRLAAGHSYKPTKNLHGQTVIVTGAATGIGRVCALKFAKLGARVIIGVRGQERAERIAKELCAESNGGTVIGYDLDLSSLANVKEFAGKIDRVDILLNNAGILYSSFSLTTDGIESTFGTNHS